MCWLLLLFLCFYKKKIVQIQLNNSSIGVVVWLLNMERTKFILSQESKLSKHKRGLYLSSFFLSFFLSSFCVLLDWFLKDPSRKKTCEDTKDWNRFANFFSENPGSSFVSFHRRFKQTQVEMETDWQGSFQKPKQDRWRGWKQICKDWSITSEGTKRWKTDWQGFRV